MTINLPFDWSFKFFQNKVSLYIEGQARQMEMRNKEIPRRKIKKSKQGDDKRANIYCFEHVMMFYTPPAIDPQTISPLKPEHSCDCGFTE